MKKKEKRGNAPAEAGKEAGFPLKLAKMAAMGDGRAAAAILRTAADGREGAALKAAMLRLKFRRLYELPEEEFERAFRLAAFMERKGVPDDYKELIVKIEKYKQSK